MAQHLPRQFAYRRRGPAKTRGRSFLRLSGAALGQDGGLHRLAVGQQLQRQPAELRQVERISQQVRVEGQPRRRGRHGLLPWPLVPAVPAVADKEDLRSPGLRL